ncbi:IS3 family transposase [Mycobacterium marinum]|uniref:IS3 family transposase n=2 Tax=Mycobacterium marinum TaxID=1781 RepID=UPI000E28B5D1|nr:IS3 family transposase [Mycobacterium marinum]WOR02327.1 IS3 family transposase [Mycobacterium marinum]WOR06870.1 IS3 family transposase [Mycobacterium marinum]
MSKPYPQEFRDDVVRVARNRDPEVPLEQIASDFGIHYTTLYGWLKKADVDDGKRAGTTTSESAELREARKRIRLLEQENEVLRRAAAYLSQAHLPKMIYPLVRELAADGIPVTVTCRVLNIARAPYYRWLDQPVTDTEWNRAHLANALFDAHRDDPEFGYRFLADEAKAAGFCVAERTVWRICSANGWFSVFGKKKRGKKAKVGAPTHDDLVRRDFTAAGPNQLWLSDITEHPTREGKLYLCAIKDVWSNRIVGYSMAERMESSIAVAALDSAVARRAAKVAGCVLHSDRGSQFRSRKLQQSLFRHRMLASMGQVGSAGDNAAMESFFSLLQKNVLNRRTWDTREQLRIAIITWIERTYHRRRRQTALGRLTPIEFETIMTQTAEQAA